MARFSEIWKVKTKIELNQLIYKLSITSLKGLIVEDQKPNSSLEIRR